MVSDDSRGDSSEDNYDKSDSGYIQGSYTLYVRRLHRDDVEENGGDSGTPGDYPKHIDRDNIPQLGKSESKSDQKEHEGDGRRDKACQLYQECDMKYDKTLPCGLTASRWKSWKDFQSEQRLLPLCKGRHVVIF